MTKFIVKKRLVMRRSYDKDLRHFDNIGSDRKESQSNDVDLSYSHSSVALSKHNITNDSNANITVTSDGNNLSEESSEERNDVAHPKVPTWSSQFISEHVIHFPTPQIFLEITSLK